MRSILKKLKNLRSSYIDCEFFEELVKKLGRYDIMRLIDRALKGKDREWFEKSLYRRCFYNEYNKVWEFINEKNKKEREVMGASDFARIMEDFLMAVEPEEALRWLSFLTKAFTAKMETVEGANWFAHRYRQIRGICIGEAAKPKSVEEAVARVNEIFGKERS